MRTDLQNYLLSGIIKSTKGEPLYRPSVKSVVSFGGAFSVAISFAAALGLILLIISKVKPLF